MVSSVTEGHIKKLRGAGYLAADIAHRLPAVGQIIPTPEPHERVVFSSPISSADWSFPSIHLSVELCITMGLIFMIFPPILSSISRRFIVVCKAFLRISPHFGLWLKIFNVKPKVVSGEHAKCGGAMVSKMPKVVWLKGTFNDSVKEWQQQWFYITEPCGKK